MESSSCPQLQEASSWLWENGTVQMGLCVFPHPYISVIDEGILVHRMVSTALSGLRVETLIYFKYH